MTAVVPERPVGSGPAARIRPVRPVNVLVGVDPVGVRPASGAALDAHLAIRRAVFVEEQGLFDGSDVDAHDARTDVVHVLATHLGRPAGTVRLYPLGGGEWLGDRLAVLPEFRAAAIGGPLVRFAVATAGARDGTRMHAHVQVANERFFHRLGWATAGARETYVGTEHVPMTTPLQSPTTPWIAGPRPETAAHA